MQQDKRLDHIHGLRGIAAIVVVIQHACQCAQEAGATLFQPLLASINLGRFGVMTFFLISGFVVPFSFRGDRPLRHFVLSRLFRLYPAYWMSLPVLACIAAVLGLRHDPMAILANVTMLQGLFGMPDIGAGYWTLRWELAFYGLCAVLYWRKMIDDPALVGWATLFALICAVALPLIGLWTGRPGVMIEGAQFMATFLLGMLLRFAFVDGSVVARRWAFALVPLAVFEGVATAGLFFPVPRPGPYMGYMAHAAGMALPVLAFVLVLWAKPVPGKIVMYLGTVSYSIYLFQDCAQRMLLPVFPAGTWPLTYVFAVLVLAVLIASIVYRWIEQPTIAMGRRVIEGPVRMRQSSMKMA